MSTLDSQRHPAIARRLQFVLLLMILWDALAVVAELSFGGPLFKVKGDDIAGILAARGSFSGVELVPILLYIYALVRGPLRHTNILLLGAFEQGAGALFAVYHVATGDIKVEGMILPVVVCAALLVLLLLNLPRGQSTTTT